MRMFPTLSVIINDDLFLYLGTIRLWLLLILLGIVKDISNYTFVENILSWVLGL